MNISEFVTSLIGEPPEGMAYLLYAVSAVFALNLLQMIFDIFRGFGKMFGSQ